MWIFKAVVALAAAAGHATALRFAGGVTGAGNVSLGATGSGLVGADESCDADDSFNCLLPAYECTQFADCSLYDGRCVCPPGFGGDDCSAPVCGSLSAGRDRMPRRGSTCDCDDGWGGINCNGLYLYIALLTLVCQTNQACNAFMPDDVEGTCFKGGLVVHENFQMCNVTNRKIVEILEGRLPQVTFSCNTTMAACNFEFWIGEIESFYCDLSQCKFSEEQTVQYNRTIYDCENIQCKCIPDRMLCGEDGSIDISDFLTEAIAGPGTFSCDSRTGICDFSEPAMDELIQDVFGDESITLTCDSGECMHSSELPGYTPPSKSVDQKFVFAAASIIIIFMAAAGLVIYYFVQLSQKNPSVTSLPTEDENYKLLHGHTPATLYFDSVSYSIGDRQVLSNVQGVVRPGELMAIMGASGAGKTSLLDILARKYKSGTVSGNFYVNGQDVSDSRFKNVVGFVDQEDYLMPTLTVYETILNSALLRLPRTMSKAAKKLRVIETMNELGIMAIRDQLIGSEGHRGISGGEKRRVAIACELVTSPSILLLDEPTSGLDSFNAFNVVECLISLARNYKRTIIFTIHQPRSNIVSLFDQLLLLAQGRVVYSGAFEKCQSYFSSIGCQCPSGFNIADFLIDLTMNASKTQLVQPAESVDHESVDGEGERLLPQTPNAASTTNESFRTDLDLLFSQYSASYIAADIKEEIERAIESSDDEHDPSTSFGNYQKISKLSEFFILSNRTFKNLYRNPMLLYTHYVIAIFLAALCGFLYYNIANDISGFQNRLGLFFFLLVLFGFSTLTSLNVFATERQIFVRERANGFYSPITYFCSKVLFDIFPLRVFPPLLLGLILYPLVGLNLESHGLYKFLLVLMLFNLTAAAVCLFIGIIIKDTGVANLVGCLVMIFGILFAGLFLNHDSIPTSALWLQDFSIFHYAFEALVVNEVRYLSLIEYKFGLSIEVPGATILSTFGFNATAYWPDVRGLLFYFCLFIVMAYVAMHYLLIEQR
ncbi:uncharacterized protein V1510DRAFT_426777 [Dipodascopsis tothii]|uniref:uncharacterized protein n=1 Tax=Dipodascopsis tothii TaxID=44089 RepID=UPI0034CD3025